MIKMTLDEFKSNLKNGEMEKSIVNYITIKEEKYSIRFSQDKNMNENENDKHVVDEKIENLFKYKNQNFLKVSLPIKPKKLVVKEELLLIIQPENKNENENNEYDRNLDFDCHYNKEEFFIIKKEEIDEIKEMEKKIMLAKSKSVEMNNINMLNSNSLAMGMENISNILFKPDKFDCPIALRSRLSFGFPY
jgi:hypothetical protein